MTKYERFSLCLLGISKQERQVGCRNKSLHHKGPLGREAQRIKNSHRSHIPVNRDVKMSKPHIYLVAIPNSEIISSDCREEADAAAALRSVTGRQPPVSLEIREDLQ